MAKVCNKCGSDLPLEAFSRNAECRDGLSRYCRACCSAKNKAYREQNRAKVLKRQREAEERYRDKRRDRMLRERYGISSEHYEAALVTQGGACAVCSAGHELLVVDHDHKTGAVRGLLCTTCNQALGAFQESLHSLEGAIDYLSRAA